MSSLQNSAFQELSSYIEILTTTGKKELDQDVMKKVKNICKTSPECLEYTYHLIMTQMDKQHAEIRYSSLLIIDELFRRSHVFRELLLNEFEEFLELTAEIDLDRPLPPPKKIARELKLKSLQLVQEWHQKFGEGYKKLVLAYTFLKDCKKVDFNDAQSRTIAERNREQQDEQRKENLSKENVNKTIKEMREIGAEIDSILVQADNCFSLLFSESDYLFTELDFKNTSSKTKKSIAVSSQISNLATSFSNSDCRSDNSDTILKTSEKEISSNAKSFSMQDSTEMPSTSSTRSDILRLHGLNDPKYNITIEIAPKNPLTVEENNDTSAVINNLKDLQQQISAHYLPKVSKWIKVFVKGTNCTDSLKKAIDIKGALESRISRFKDLKIKPKELSFSGSNSDDDDDLEEVPAKEGYEPIIPSYARKEYGLDPLPSTSSSCSAAKATERLWNLSSQEEDLKDPTSRLSTINVLCKKMEESKSKMVDALSGKYKSQNIEKSRKERLLTHAPRRPYDIDLYHWEEEKLEAPCVVKYDIEPRFWQPLERDPSDTQNEENIASLRRRIIDFSGEFKPVKWACRAPLMNGKLCPRKDRLKCPFHGKIIPRDEQGNPVIPDNKLEQKNPLPESQGAESVPDWQDPDLLRDIEAATGINLEIPSKNKKNKKGKIQKKQRKKKFPGLTDIKGAENTARKRLEKRVLSKASVKRVSETLDNLDKKRFMDKYGNQWNYSFQA